MKNITIAISGASGTIYAKRLIDRAILNPEIDKIHLIFSKNGILVAEHETGGKWIKDLPKKVIIIDNDDFFSPIASGSACDDAMIIIPCSMGILGRVANGVSNDLISRACDVMLKERKRLIFVIRETPYNLIHIENMRTITLAGGVILPASPSFYKENSGIDELIDSVVERVESHIGLQTERYKWTM